VRLSDSTSSFLGTIAGGNLRERKKWVGLKVPCAPK